MRLQILRVLADQSYSVQELCQIFSLRQPNMSHHLKLLMEQGLLSARKEGNCVYYSRAIELPDVGADIIAQVLLAIDEQVLDQMLAEQVGQIELQRESACEAFFSKHIDDFHTNQERIVSYTYYNPTVFELLMSQGLPSSAKVAEVGPGEGAFLAELAQYFDTVYAVDISADMLALSKTYLAEKHLQDTVCFVQGELDQLPEQAKQLDAVVMNMVLHHVSSPQQTIKQAAHHLKIDGVLLVCDLVSHDQTWVKEYCGDLWLGFSQAQLMHWAEASQLRVEKFSFSGLRNGFQLLFGVFRKVE